MASEPYTGTFYLTIGADERRHRTLTTPRVTKNKPSIARGHVAIKLEIRIPSALFKEWIPAGVIELPEDAGLGRPAVTVRVPDGVEVTPDVELVLMPWTEEVVDDG